MHKMLDNKENNIIDHFLKGIPNTGENKGQ